MVLTGARQFELRAKKALANGDISYKPRGSANKAAFDKLKREFDEQTKQVNAHTTAEADRIIEATSNRVLASIEERTETGGQDRPNPGAESDTSDIARLVDFLSS